MNFRKIRINSYKETEDNKLYKKMAKLKDGNGEKNKEAIEEVVEAIARVAEAKCVKVIDQLNQMKPEGGKIDSQRLEDQEEAFPKEQGPTVSHDRQGGDLTDHR